MEGRLNPLTDKDLLSFRANVYLNIDEKNPKLKEKYMIFSNDYIDRATNIKKTYLVPE